MKKEPAATELLSFERYTISRCVYMWGGLFSARFLFFYFFPFFFLHHPPRPLFQKTPAASTHAAGYLLPHVKSLAVRFLLHPW